jgi:hypothetical protein
MSTVTEPWHAEADRKFRERFKHETQKHEIAGLLERAGMSDDAAREALKVCDRADVDLAGMESHIGELNERSDAAVRHHAEETEPLQARLAADDVPAAERVAIRAKINAANSRLEATMAEVRPLLEAADKEYQLLRSRASIRGQIENVFCGGGSPEQKERLAILRKTAEMLEQRVLFGLNKAEQVETDPIRYGVWKTISGFARQIRDEQAEIRQQRLRELYKTDEPSE